MVYFPHALRSHGSWCARYNTIKQLLREPAPSRRGRKCPASGRLGQIELSWCEASRVSGVPVIAPLWAGALLGGPPGGAGIEPFQPRWRSNRRRPSYPNPMVRGCLLVIQVVKPPSRCDAGPKPHLDQVGLFYSPYSPIPPIPYAYSGRKLAKNRGGGMAGMGEWPKWVYWAIAWLLISLDP